MVTSTGLALMAVVASATSRDSVAVMPLTSDRLEQPVVAALNDLLLVAMDRRGSFEVVSPADISAQLGLAAMKQSLGCNDITCATELGGSLGVRYILTGSARKLGGRLILTVNLLDTRGQVAVGRGTADVKATEAEYPGAIHAALDDLLEHVRAAQGAADEAKQPGEDLFWTRCPVGQTWKLNRCVGAVQQLSYADARKACPEGRRLATREELAGLLARCELGVVLGKPSHCATCAESRACSEIYANTIEYVWTGTTEGDRTWVVSFETGKVMRVATVGNTNAVLCVRAAN